MASLRIDVWSDVACPWCWVGKRHLEQAIEEFEGDVDVHWRAFELNPRAKVSDGEPIDYIEKLAAKYHTSRDGAQQMVDRMVETGKGSGLEFRFDHVKPTNTFDAHRLLAMAAGTAEQNDLKEKLFEAYMNEGRLVSDADELVAIAMSAGIDEGKAREALSGEKFYDEVRADEMQARQMGVTGVPFFVINNAYAIPGAQPAEMIRRAMEAAAAKTQPFSSDGGACDETGCEVQ